MIPLPFILGGGAIAAYFLMRKKPEHSGSGARSPYCATVSFPNPPAPATTHTLAAWMAKWANQPNADAQTAFLDLMRMLRPDCRWDAGTTTVLLRPGAPGPEQVPMQKILAALRGHTLTEANAVLAAELGMQSSSPTMDPDGIRRFLAVAP